MRKLHPRRLCFGEAEFLLKVLVHDVDHAVAKAPEQKQRADQNERKHQVLPVLANEKASVEELLAIAKRASAQVKRPYLGHAAFLYDERGLPK